MRRRRLLLAFVCALGLASGADFSGRWTATNERHGRIVTRTIVLRVDGQRITGEVIFPGLGPASIEDGGIEGNHVSFTVVRKRDGAEVRRQWRGALKGEELHLTVVGEGDLQMVARREGTK